MCTLSRPDSFFRQPITRLVQSPLSPIQNQTSHPFLVKVVVSKWCSIPMMSLPNSRVSVAIFLSFIFFTSFPGLMLCAVVSLNSIEVFRTHEWLKATSTVYFLCTEENKTVLPDVKRPHVFYSFNGNESWQPLSSFSSKKCKRCGLYEEDSITSDDVFEEWEFCPSDFTGPDGEYNRFKEKEFNATFLCQECLSLAGVSSSSDGKGMHIAVAVLLSVLASIIVILGVMGAYKFWLKKIREQDQTRLLKLFEDGDYMEDELGLGGFISGLRNIYALTPLDVSSLEVRLSLTFITGQDLLKQLIDHFAFVKQDLL
ncbi:uncharacterized protein LOC130720963 isoform X2 [Lotus japonicus]|uniref:uncharacterized protein LOC130720963 isoform X2 n=1 Tax=Lotus japonicus TaxID=34305 RepID=UPI002590B27B|nr:uncharacterized protein LOC130720963 isoform X2 [Lotus japonicus]